jgi:hypothetical protein
VLVGIKIQRMCVCWNKTSENVHLLE